MDGDACTEACGYCGRCTPGLGRSTLTWPRPCAFCGDLMNQPPMPSSTPMCPKCRDEHLAGLKDDAYARALKSRGVQMRTIKEAWQLRKART